MLVEIKVYLVELIDVALAGEQRPLHVQLGEYAADAPHVYRGRVCAVQENLVAPC